MGNVRFIFALHQHQPVGNFDSVFRRAFDTCYNPLLSVLEKEPTIRVVLHYSGPLIDWLEANEPGYLRRIKKLVHRNQVELMSGGYYEPLLSLIPRADAIGQMEKMNRYVEKRFGVKPKGFWLTERVWEPSFPEISQAAGLSYTTLDDTHFLYAGLGEDQMRDYYVTEDKGNVLFVFPISKALRYLIPFRQAHEIIDYFRPFRDQPGDVVLTLADDGEKFGLWPGTHKWVYEDGWMEQFFTQLKANSDWLKLVTFSEVIQSQPPRGKVYLPTASYEEMMEWSLPADKIVQLEQTKELLKTLGKLDQCRVFLRGGYFRNFFSKYSEAQNMMNKVYYVSEKVHAMAAGKTKQEALKELWMGQCNCPYWHGVFGGLYLHHLRRSTYEHLLRAEVLANHKKKGESAGRLVQIDFNRDGRDEVILETSRCNVTINPGQGGTITEVDFTALYLNVSDVMTRRREAYHEEILKQKAESATGSSQAGKSIHELTKRASKEVFDHLFYDAYPKVSWVDHLLNHNATIQWMKEGQLGREYAFYHQPYACQPIQTKGRLGVELELNTQLWHDGKVFPFSLRKTIVITKSGLLQFQITLQHQGNHLLEGWYANEWNFCLKDLKREERNLTHFRLDDEWSRLRVTFEADRPFNWWQVPIETVSQSEKDYPLSYQGMTVLPHWSIQLKPKQIWTVKFTIQLSEK